MEAHKLAAVEIKPHHRGFTISAGNAIRFAVDLRSGGLTTLCMSS